ncbi:uncharacterized protein [Dermacentor albipictus]|uniref:uncharacterized protein isoform X1 n=1 Tax=Dermacentor albipictus TaxID=60249 RepID=UPI0038FBE7F5
MRNAAPFFPLLWRIATPLLLCALQAPLLLGLATATLLLPAHGADEAQPLGAQCSGEFECQNPEMVHCTDGICACRYGHHSPYLCKEAPVTQRPGKDGEEENGWPAVADRECHTDHQCHRGYCWHGTCSCKDGFVKERSFSGSWSCVHRTSSFGFGILAVIPVTVVVLCLFACCVQVALRKQQQMPSNAAAVQPEGAQDDGNAGTSAAGVSNIYRQRRYFPHYVESPKPHATNEALAAPTASCATGMEPVEAKETAPGIGEAGSSANANHSLQA